MVYGIATWWCGENPSNIVSINLILDGMALETIRREVAEENIPHYFRILC